MDGRLQRMQASFLCSIFSNRKFEILWNDFLHEMISGHRRMHAAKRAQLKKIPAIVMDTCSSCAYQ